MTVHNYEVAAPDGRGGMSAPESCRYPRRIELQLLEAGYIIRLNGRKLTKTEVRKEIK